MVEPGRRYDGKVTIVTGGAGGIAKGIVETFVRHGSKVVFCDLKVKEGEELETALNEKGLAKAKFVKCDVMKEEEMKKLVDITVETFGRIDCVVAVAGYHPPVMTIDDFTSEDFSALMKLNVTHPLLLAKFSLPYLRKTQGNIIFMASINATVGQRGAITYDATKGAVTAMTRTLAIDESQYHVRVNSVSPAVIWTPLTEEFMNTCGFDDPAGYFKSFSVLNRMGLVSEVANACLYLAADATFSTGTDLTVSGGTELGFSPKVRGSQ